MTLAFSKIFQNMLHDASSLVSALLPVSLAWPNISLVSISHQIQLLFHIKNLFPLTYTVHLIVMFKSKFCSISCYPIEAILLGLSLTHVHNIIFTLVQKDVLQQ